MFTAVYTCITVDDRIHGRVRVVGRVHGTRPCTRAVYINSRVHGPSPPCTYIRSCTYTAVYIHDRVHRRVHSRVHDRVDAVYWTVYMARVQGCVHTRPCTPSCTQSCSHLTRRIALSCGIKISPVGSLD